MKKCRGLGTVDIGHTLAWKLEQNSQSNMLIHQEQISYSDVHMFVELAVLLAIANNHHSSENSTTGGNDQCLVPKINRDMGDVELAIPLHHS